VGTLAFEQEYQANPIDDSIRVFRPEWLQRYDPRELVEQNLITLMAVDPATGVSGGDFFAVWIGGLDRTTGIIYTRELTLERIGIVEQVKRIVAAFRRWRPLRTGIETVAYQVALKQILEDHSRKQRLYMPIVPIQTTANKRARIEGSSPFYENGTFRLPPALDPEIESQFLHFPKAKHDDAPDVCAMGIELARSFCATSDVEGVTIERNPFSRSGGW
jgi:predicted phage terminase large subunit-like protein